MKIKNQKGFTLIELLTAVSIFIVIMTISMGALLGVFDANRRSESLKTVMDNLNFAVESMSRELRFGTNYFCSTNPSASVSFTNPQNCTNGGGVLIGFVSSTNDQIIYRLNSNKIEKSTNGSNFIAVTAPEIIIRDLNFIVVGTGKAPANTLQPKVMIKIKGEAGSASKPSSLSSFTLQTLVSQRVLDQ